LDLDFDRRRYYYWYFTCYKKSADKKVAKGYIGFSAILKYNNQEQVRSISRQRCTSHG
jgi:hypothetical protein